MYTTHVLGIHIKPGDEIATDDQNIWHIIRDVSEYSEEPYLLRLTLNNEAHMIVRADQSQRIRRHSKSRDETDIEETVAVYGSAAVDALDEEGC